MAARSDTGAGPDVLVVGAGATGLTLALELALRGVRVRVVDKAPAPSDRSRAIGVQARTLEHLERLGIADDAVSRGVMLAEAVVMARRREIGRIDFRHLDSRYRYLLTLPQDETERLLTARLAGLGVTVERPVELMSFEADDDGVTAHLDRADGPAETLRVPWMVGADGAHSAVRHHLRLPFEGTAYAERWALADVHLDWRLDQSTARIFVSADGPLIVLPLPGGRARLILQAEDPEFGGDALEDYQEAVDARGPGGAVLGDPHWLTLFRIHRRQTPRYRQGRVFLAGDSAHIHSPAGGQGMNTGIGDAVNLGWKLALAVKGAATGALLDSYEAERHAVGAGVLRMTDLMTRAMTWRRPVLQQLRDRAMALGLRLPVVRRMVAARLSQLTHGYRGSPIVGEDRRPWMDSLRRLPGAPPLSGRLQFAAGPAAGDRAPPGGAVDLRTGAAVTIAGAQPALGCLVLFFAGTGPGRDAASLAAIGRSVERRFADRVATAVVVATPGDAPGEGWSSPVWIDADVRLHTAYGAGAGGAVVLRPDGHVGFRSQPADQAALIAHLSRLFA